MKKIIFLMLLALSTKTVAQMGNGVVHDPKNNVQLIKLGLFLEKIKTQGQQAIKTLETAKVIQQYSKARDFVSAIEESYCIIQDLDYYKRLNTNNMYGNEGCFDDVNYKINLKGLENSIWQTLLALKSTVMTLGERQQAIQDAFDNLKSSNKELNSMKEKLRKKYESQEDRKKSLKILASWF